MAVTMLLSGVVSAALSLCLVTGSPASRKDFVAAVYEFPAFSAYATSRAEAVDCMAQNLDVFDEQSRKAKEKGAFIIVFPEYGVSGGYVDPSSVPNPRQVLYPYMEQIPDVTSGPVCTLCSQPLLGTESIQRLACIARNNHIYIVANMIDMQPCDRSTDPRCPTDDHYQYNTNVIFDSNGCLIAKYHKQNLYAEEAITLDAPEFAEFVYFDTEFGRFGTMICFDALYKEPGISLVETYGVDHILFPTYWDNNNDYHWARSLQVFTGWSRRMGVNFIASNYNDIGFETQGSSLSTPLDLVSYIFVVGRDTSKLVYGRLPACPKCLINNRPLPIVTEHIQPTAVQQYGEISVYGEIYNATVITGYRGSVSVSYDYLRCDLNFERSSKDETFVFAAFVGMQVSEGPYYVEVCLLYRCPSNNLASCSERVSTSYTSFSYFKLRATFGADHVFPNVLPSAYRFEKIPIDFRRNGSVNELSGGSIWPLVSAALLGRDYTKDPATQW